MRTPPRTPNPEIVELEAKLKALKQRDAVLTLLKACVDDLERGVVSADGILQVIVYRLGCNVTLGANLDHNVPSF